MNFAKGGGGMIRLSCPFREGEEGCVAAEEVFCGDACGVSLFYGVYGRDVYNEKLRNCGGYVIGSDEASGSLSFFSSL